MYNPNPTHECTSRCNNDIDCPMCEHGYDCDNNEVCPICDRIEGEDDKVETGYNLANIINDDELPTPNTTENK